MSPARRRNPTGVAGPSDARATTRSASIEDYVKVIYTHTEWQTAPATGSLLAAKLGLSPSSVTEMVQKLARLGLVTHQPYGAVSLTEEGRALAVEMVRRHRLLETYLVHALGYTWEEVHVEAEVLEHVVSPLLLERIDLTLGRPRRDPHGDPIPDRYGAVDHPPAVLVAQAPDGAAGRVVRISDADPGLLVSLSELGIALDALITVVGPLPTGGRRLAVAGRTIDLADVAAGAIWISR